MQLKLWLALPAVLYLFGSGLPGCQPQKPKVPAAQTLCSGSDCAASGHIGRVDGSGRRPRRWSVSI